MGNSSRQTSGGGLDCSTTKAPAWTIFNAGTIYQKGKHKTNAIAKTIRYHHQGWHLPGGRLNSCPQIISLDGFLTLFGTGAHYLSKKTQVNSV